MFGKSWPSSQTNISKCETTLTHKILNNLFFGSKQIHSSDSEFAWVLGKFLIKWRNPAETLDYQGQHYTVFWNTWDL